MPQMCPKCGKDNRDTGRFCAYCQTQLQGLLGSRARLQNRYEIISLLGCGGMGAVYLALDHRLGQNQVAVKENFNASPQAQAQFQREANVLAKLSHPNLPKVIDHFIEPTGRQYLVMEYIGGSNLDVMIQQRGALPEAQVLAWADELLDALAYLHGQRQPIIHRDIKPANIKVAPDGKIKLVDFGLVKFFDPTNPRTSTSMRGLGTPEYAPPEQYNATGFTDSRSDLYSLGATLYHLLTGQAPATATLRMANPSVLRPPRQLLPAIQPSTEATILRAMELPINNRFQAAAEMRRALRGMVPGKAAVPSGPRVPVPASPQVRPALARNWPRLWLNVGATALTIALLAVGLLAAWNLFLAKSRPIPQVALATAAPATAVALVTVAPTSLTATSVPLAATVVALSTQPPAGAPSVTPPAATRAATTATPAPTLTVIPTTRAPLPTTPADKSTHMLGEPWEQAETSLNMIRLEVRAESNWEDAAAQVWFRFFNKTGQKLLVEIDWNKIYLEDSLGNRYVDWEGGGSTSAWVETGTSLDFNRYYTRQPKERSRVPSSVSFVRVMVDQFSRIAGARWQISINPALVPMQAPAPSTAKRVGEAWEQGGLALTLKNLQIRAESDWEDASAQAWFILSNRTSERRLVEIDFAHIYMIDSYGRRFNDWEGGGLMSQWIDAGKTLEFNRYYSEMAGQRSRITHGAGFVLLKFEGLGSLDSGQWQLDIVR